MPGLVNPARNRAGMQACADCLNEEFKPENAGLGHNDPSVFLKSQWPLGQSWFLAYRVIVAVLMVIWVSVDLWEETSRFYSDKPWVWLVFATNWSFLLLVLTAIIHAICVVYYACKLGETLDRDTFQQMPWSLKLYWSVYNMSASSAVVVTISYWAFISFMDQSAFLQTNMSQVKHSLNTCYVVFDLFLCGVPIRVLHMFFPIMLGSIYSTFNAIYFLNDGTVIDGRHYAYSVLDWQSPASAIVTCMLAMIQTILSQCILYELYRLRMWIFSKLYFTRDEPATASEMQSIISTEPIKYATIDEEPKGVEEPSP